MDFTNIYFWAALVPGLLLIAFVGKGLLRRKESMRSHFEKYALLILSLCLLGMTSGLTLAIFLCVALTAWLGVRWALPWPVRRKKMWLWVLIPLLLIPLLYYKYSYFLGQQILGQEWSTLKNLIIPVGLSFYTFQKIGFCIDTLSRGYSLPRFVDFLNFASFFPQIVAGPIERRDSLLPQMENLKLEWKTEQLDLGLRYIILGLFFKLCLADNIATGFAGRVTDNPWQIWSDNIAFGLRIYFDFAGYGLIAFGLARALGISITMNFASPYTASNMTEFWRRWHISLTGWFRDYLYFNIGGSRTKWWAANIVFVFLISGLWHGSAWNFVLWGGLSGVAMVIHRLYRKAGWKMWPPFGYVLTMLAMAYIWMFFYESDISALWEKTKTLADFASYAEGWKAFLTVKTHTLLFAFFFVLCASVVYLERLSQRRTGDPYAWLASPVACGFWIVLTVIFGAGSDNAFIYFAF